MKKEISNKILDLLHDAVVSEGGDGGALWFSKFATLEGLLSVVTKYNYENNIGWYVELFELNIVWHNNGQESVIITNNGEYFMGLNPSFYNLILEY